MGSGGMDGGGGWMWIELAAAAWLRQTMSTMAPSRRTVALRGWSARAVSQCGHVSPSAQPHQCPELECNRLAADRCDGERERKKGRKKERESACHVCSLTRIIEIWTSREPFSMFRDLDVHF